MVEIKTSLGEKLDEQMESDIDFVKEKELGGKMKKSHRC